MRIEYYLPEKIFSNADLESEFPDWNAAKVEEKVGIRERHIVGPNETALDLALKASEKLLAGEDREQVDFLILCTQSPDYFLPTSACLLQDRLNLKKQCGALDFNLGCSCFIYGLALSKGLLLAGIAKKILLVTAETYSRHMHREDRANRSIFGDGAAATLLDPEDARKTGEFELGTDGSGWRNLIIEAGAMKRKFDPELKQEQDENGNFSSPNYLYMNGPEIFNFTIENVPAMISKVLEKNHCSIEDIRYFIPHQANKYMLEYLRKKMKIPAEKYHNNILLTGNTVSSTIPIGLKDCMDSGTIQPGDKILLAGFGVGYSWGAVVMEINFQAKETGKI